VENLGARIITIHIEECTPLEVIPWNISYMSQELGMDEVVVVVGYYYYIRKTRSIERISSKIKRE